MTEIGVVTTILVLLFTISFALYLGTPDHRSSLMFSIISGTYNGSGLKTQFLIMLGVTGITTVAVVLLALPSQYAPFIAITSFLLTFVTLPTDLMVNAELPTELQILLGGVFSIMYIMGLLGWFKGGGRP